MQPDPKQIAQLIAEDLGGGDLSADLLDQCILATGKVHNRQGMVMCGQKWFDAIFASIDSQTQVIWHAKEGEYCQKGGLLCSITGTACSILSGERAALNILQTLSATATTTREYLNNSAGATPLGICRVLDTRKTIPGLRLAQKYAVRCGGGNNHRDGLGDGILLKENHLIALGGVANAVQVALKKSNGVPVMVEVENLQQLAQALSTDARRIILDNFSLADLKTAVQLHRHQQESGDFVLKKELEASGNITLENIRAITSVGLDFVSVGALTKNIAAIDLSMRITLDQ